jgi:hypothetical protein
MAEEMWTWPPSGCDWEISTDTVSGYFQAPEWSEEKREEVREKFRKNLSSNPYPEYIAPPWGEK